MTHRYTFHCCEGTPHQFILTYRIYPSLILSQRPRNFCVFQLSRLCSEEKNPCRQILKGHRDQESHKTSDRRYKLTTCGEHPLHLLYSRWQNYALLTKDRKHHVPSLRAVSQCMIMMPFCVCLSTRFYFLRVTRFSFYKLKRF